MQAVGITFPYALTDIPKGCRRGRTMLAWGSATAAIRTASPEDMQLAFRVEFPTANRLRYVAHPIPTLYRTRDSTEYVNIYRYQAKLWWPMKIDADRTKCDQGVLPDLLKQLDSRCHDLLNMLPPGISPAGVIARPQMRSVENDGYGLAEAFVQRTVYENLLIYGHRVFARGGTPVYVKNSLGRKRSWEIQAADLGPDRAARTVRVGLRTELDVFTDWWVQDAFRKGLLWQADMHDAASAAAHRMQTTMPKIEAFGDETHADKTQIVVLDAIFREALQIAEYWRDDQLVDKLSPGMEDTDDEDTTARRRMVLAQFFQAIADRNLDAGMIEFRDCFLRFDNAFLAPEDEDALSRINACKTICRRGGPPFPPPTS